MQSSRRQFLKTSAALGLGGAAGFMSDLHRFNAFAADTGGYRALVCVFLFGGMDCHDTVLPYDTGSYNQYAGIRREPELPEHEEIVPPPPSPAREFDILDDEPDLDTAKARALRQRMRAVARQASMNPDDGIEL